MCTNHWHDGFHGETWRQAGQWSELEQVWIRDKFTDQTSGKHGIRRPVTGPDGGYRLHDKDEDDECDCATHELPWMPIEVADLRPERHVLDHCMQLTSSMATAS